MPLSKANQPKHDKQIRGHKRHHRHLSEFTVARMRISQHRRVSGIRAKAAIVMSHRRQAQQRSKGG